MDFSNPSDVDFEFHSGAGAQLGEDPSTELAHNQNGSSSRTEAATASQLQGISSRLSTGPDPRTDQSISKPMLKTLHELEALMKDGRHTIMRDGVSTNCDHLQLGSAILFEVVEDESRLYSMTEVRYLPLVSTEPRTVTRLPSGETTWISHLRGPSQFGPGFPAGVPNIIPVGSPPGIAAGLHQDLPQGLPQGFPQGFLQGLPPGHVFAAPLPGQRRQGPSVPPSGQTPEIPTSQDRPLDILPETRLYIDAARARRSLCDAPNAESGALSSGTLNGRSSLGGDTISTTCRWPSNFPTELFEKVTQSLSYGDVRNMRLVCKEFAWKTSPVLFKEVVVPFTTELYDMIEDDFSVRLHKTTMKDQNGKSVGSFVGSSTLPEGLTSYRPSEDAIYYRKSSETAPRHGLRVFQGFGPHMNRFGIRFEVTESDLAVAPSKKINTKHTESYYGVYEWPLSGYTRFGRLAGLEKVADETPRMTAALETLVNVQEIGLSLDSGLGYLHGPDMSHHDIIFDRPAAMFDADSSKRFTTDGIEAFWSSLRQSHASFATGARLAHERFFSCILTTDRNPYAELPTVSATAYDDTTLWPSVAAEGILSGVRLTAPVRGVLYTAAEETTTLSNSTSNKLSPPLSPASLSSEQNQWLLETGWAQSAFLDTYILALGDNPGVFYQVTKVTISKISSGLLSKLDQEEFWDALPSVKDVTLLVNPDWRTVCKDEAGCAVTRSHAPSLGVTTFHAVIRRVARLDEIQKMRFGYTEGGELGKGIFGRNSHLLPVPIAALDQILDPNPGVLSLDHVKDVTLVNCWITPPVLRQLTSTRKINAVAGRRLTFESVSLTASTSKEIQDSARIDVGTIHEFRGGCWPALINELGGLVHPNPQVPGYIAYPITSTTAEPEIRPAAYEKITFASCGYTILLNLARTFDQSAIELGSTMIPAHIGHEHIVHDSEWFRRRVDQLRDDMMTSKDDYFGRVVPWISSRELVVFKAWGMQVGLPVGQGEEAEYDGLPRRGTGRFWGHIRADEPLFSPIDAMSVD
jgi:hypothetical protein